MIYDLAVQSDDKIVAVGFVNCLEWVGGCSFHAGVARYNVDGSLDTTFSGDGRVVFDWSSFPTSYATSVAVQPDGKIVVAGGVHFSSNSRLGVARFNPDGSLDQTFGDGGKVLTTLPGPFSSFIADMELQPDGKIVAVADTGERGYTRLAVVRYLSNGELDPSFGDGGAVYVAPPAGSNCVSAGEIAVQSDGRLVVRGGACDPSFRSVLARLLQDGRADPAFGDAGLVNIEDTTAAAISDLAIQPDGRIVTAGSALVRYRTDGSLDPSFGGTGIVRGEDIGGNALAVRDDGTIVTATTVSGDDGMMIIHWNSDGTYETPTVVQVGKASSALAVAVQSDGRVVAGGYSHPDVYPNFKEAEFALVRVPAQRTTPTIVNPPPGPGGSSGVSKPVEAYAPVVWLHSLEWNYPASPFAFVANAELRWSHDNECEDHAIAEYVDPLALGHGGYSHVSANDACEDVEREYASDESARPKSSKPVLGDEGFFLDIPNEVREPLGDLANAPVFYVFNNRSFISYWFFYAFNRGPMEIPPFAGIDDHEGDWENIVIRLDCSNQPIGVAYYSHGDPKIYDWPGEEATPEDPSASESGKLSFDGGTHPVVFSALGSHASYPDTGLPPLGQHGPLEIDLPIPGTPTPFFDYTDQGQRWDTESRLRALTAQPWHGYGGAWGEVGEEAATTGPQGPHYPDKKSAPDDWYGECVP